MTKHILVIADIEDDGVISLEKAHDITIPISATVEIIKFIHHEDESEITPTQHIEQAERSLSSTIYRIFGGSTAMTSEVVISDDIANWVVERCTRSPVDLVIKGGYRSESLFHTPSDWQLIRRLPCPILIACQVKWKSKANILLALDLSTDESIYQQLNALILSWGDTWSKAGHGQLHAMYSIPIAKPLLEFDLVDKESVELKKAAAAKEKMQELLAQFDMSSITNHITAGPPDRTIPHLANELQCDLVIMGCIGREGFSGFLLGNTAEKVVHKLRTDCLIIKLAQD